jgi:hypothetical protein
LIGTQSAIWRSDRALRDIIETATAILLAPKAAKQAAGA